MLGPLLFLIYINDLTSKSTHSQPFLYTDDTTIVTKDKSIDVLTNKLSADFRNIDNWCKVNGLTINTNRTQFIVFHSSHNTHLRLLSMAIAFLVPQSAHFWE